MGIEWTCPECGRTFKEAFIVHECSAHAADTTVSPSTATPGREASDEELARAAGVSSGARAIRVLAWFAVVGVVGGAAAYGAFSVKGEGIRLAAEKREQEREERSQKERAAATRAHQEQAVAYVREALVSRGFLVSSASLMRDGHLFVAVMCPRETCDVAAASAAAAAASPVYELDTIELARFDGRGGAVDSVLVNLGYARQWATKRISVDEFMRTWKIARQEERGPGDPPRRWSQQ